MCGGDGDGIAAANPSNKQNSRVRHHPWPIAVVVVVAITVRLLAIEKKKIFAHSHRFVRRITFFFDFACKCHAMTMLKCSFSLFMC